LQGLFRLSPSKDGETREAIEARGRPIGRVRGPSFFSFVVRLFCPALGDRARYAVRSPRTLPAPAETSSGNPFKGPGGYTCGGSRPPFFSTLASTVPRRGVGVARPPSLRSPGAKGGEETLGPVRVALRAAEFFVALPCLLDYLKSLTAAPAFIFIDGHGGYPPFLFVVIWRSHGGCARASSVGVLGKSVGPDKKVLRGLARIGHESFHGVGGIVAFYARAARRLLQLALSRMGGVTGDAGKLAALEWVDWMNPWYSWWCFASSNTLSAFAASSVMNIALRSPLYSPLKGLSG
jgi:hypothetical protein